MIGLWEQFCAMTDILWNLQLLTQTPNLPHIDLIAQQP